MTPTVVSLDSRRRNRPPACGCPRHSLEALTERATRELAGTEGQLLVDRQLVVALVDDLCVTVRSALETSQGRTNP
jgi:hypothetical protein